MKFDQAMRGLSVVIKSVLFIAIIISIAHRDWATTFVAGLAFILSFAPALMRRNYSLALPPELELILIAFLYASIFLGGAQHYYTRFWWWDLVMHTGSGVALGFVGFLALYVLNAEDKVLAKPIWVAFFSFCFAVAMGALWEIFEFCVDLALKTHMQPSLLDTMGDLIVDCGGALVSSIIGYLYLKKMKVPVFERLLKRFLRENPGIRAD